MRLLLYLIIFVFIIPFEIAAQGDETVYVEANTRSWGFKAGGYFGKLSEGSENPMHEDGYEISWDVDYGTKFKPGVTFGLFLESKVGKNIFFQIEANYIWSQQGVKYIKYINDEANTKRTADFTTKTSSFQIPIFPKYRFGNKYKFFIMLGPYISIPFTSNVSGTIVVEEEIIVGKPTEYVISGNGIKVNPEKLEIGWMAGATMKIPLKNDDMIIEFRGGRSFNDVMSSPNYKNNFLTFTLGVIKPL